MARTTPKETTTMQALANLLARGNAIKAITVTISIIIACADATRRPERTPT